VHVVYFWQCRLLVDESLPPPLSAVATAETPTAFASSNTFTSTAETAASINTPALETPAVETATSIENPSGSSTAAHIGGLL